MIDLVEKLGDNEKIVTSLTSVEVRSAIRRRQHAGDIPWTDAESAVVALVEEVRRMVEHPITSVVLEESSALIDRRNLRALDAIQLATALLARKFLPDGDSILFVGSDTKLLEAAVAEGFAIWNPATS